MIASFWLLSVGNAKNAENDKENMLFCNLSATDNLVAIWPLNRYFGNIFLFSCFRRNPTYFRYVTQWHPCAEPSWCAFFSHHFAPNFAALNTYMHHLVWPHWCHHIINILMQILNRLNENEIHALALKHEWQFRNRKKKNKWLRSKENNNNNNKIISLTQHLERHVILEYILES